ncbi:MAG: hypothetical protein AC479_05505 [miscellaneous Crenarchaeota group-6 archaeon AD8-1]|nr:MAG: hypothetical protein AC479_05505 [miscellaneous Crenarchaeota group-6 archaeon AD8-1]
MKTDIWLKEIKKVQLKDGIAIVGSPGLGSIGKLSIDYLVKETKAELTATLYSSHLPLIYHTKPAYLAHYSLPGSAGIKIKQNEIDLPKVDFFTKEPKLILTSGYHANFDGCYEIAEEVVKFLKNNRIKRIIITAGYGSKEKKVCCAATSQKLIQEMKNKYNIETEYQGPFYGFSGLVFGAAKLQQIEAISLFSGVEAKPGNPEFPNEESAKLLIDILKKMIKTS